MPARNSVKFDELVMATARGASLTKAAARAGIPLRTAQRWMASPDAKEAIKAARTAMMDSTLGKLCAASCKAVDTLVEVLTETHSPASRVRAARVLLMQMTALSRHIELAEQAEQAQEAIEDPECNCRLDQMNV